MIPEKLWETGLQIVLIAVMTLHLYVKRQERKRLRDPEEDRRRPQNQIAWELELIKRDIDAITKRLDREGGKTSDLATLVQRMPDDFRREFADRTVSYNYAETCARERAAMKDQIRDLEDKFERFRDGHRGPIRVDRGNR